MLHLANNQQIGSSLLQACSNLDRQCGIQTISNGNWHRLNTCNKHLGPLVSAVSRLRVAFSTCRAAAAFLRTRRQLVS
jgi:hypothetical protein